MSRLTGEQERAMTELLRAKLPRYAAPQSLKQSLEARVRAAPARAERAKPSFRFRRSLALPVLTLSLAAALVLFVRSAGWFGAPEPNRMVAEAVNDHLRVLYAERPIEIASGGIHQVKPWFSGRLDFAPQLAFGGDSEFVLEGGAVAYFIDRKAATFVFKRRLHTISLFVFRAESLPWPEQAAAVTSSFRPASADERGFQVVLFRERGLGYVLVSDISREELLRLAPKLIGAR
jgi:anti-sigma factor RsiW